MGATFKDGVFEIEEVVPQTIKKTKMTREELLKRKDHFIKAKAYKQQLISQYIADLPTYDSEVAQIEQWLIDNPEEQISEPKTDQILK